MSTSGSETVWFIERLTLVNYCRSVLPILLRRRFVVPTTCYVLEGSNAAMKFAAVTAAPFGVKVSPWNRTLAEVRDGTGALILHAAQRDLREVQKGAFGTPLFAELHPGVGSRLLLFLSKRAAVESGTGRPSQLRAVLAIKLARWWQDRTGSEMKLFLLRRAWLTAVERFARRSGIEVVAVAGPAPLVPLIRRLAGPKALMLVQLLWHRRSLRALWWKAGPPAISNERALTARSRIAAECYGQSNLTAPERHSDLFILHTSGFDGSEVVTTHGVPTDPVDAQRYELLTRHGVGIVVTHPAATTTREAPFFRGCSVPRQNGKWDLRFASLAKTESQWLRESLRSYWSLREYWADVFATHKVKAYLSWVKFDERHCAIGDAIEDVGGVSATYQRSYEPTPAPDWATAADVAFCFSRRAAEISRASGSLSRFHVVTGYLGDHRFRLLQPTATALRRRLTDKGVTRIVAYFDENSHAGKWWTLGHDISRQNYAFLLQRVLSEPDLGLVLKPKVPASLRRRLGEVVELLDRALETGRCYLFDEGTLHGWYPPAAAALSADVAIHGHLVVGTAGCEAALANVPTLLVDIEGCSWSPLYRLGEGRVIFRDWATLWKTCRAHWARPGSVPGFGDWSPMLSELDPFRDGRAAARLTSYLRSLLDGFNSGLQRDAALDRAAEQYSAAWGHDMVIEAPSGERTDDILWPGEAHDPFATG